MSGKLLKYLILLAFFLLIIAISSFWFGGSSFREKDVVVKIEGPTQISSGEEVIYKLKYSNETRTLLHDLNFKFFYPDGSVSVADAGAVKNQEEQFKIKELVPEEKGEREFKVFVVGEKGDIKLAKVIVSYRAGSLKSVFEKEVSLAATITNAPISLTLVAPPNSVNNANVDYIFDYRNKTDEDLSDLLVELEYPDGFKPKEFNPDPSIGNYSWEIKHLKKGEGGRIIVTGLLDGQEGEDKVVSAILKRKINGHYVDYQNISAMTVINNPVLGLEISVNNSGYYTASLGEHLEYLVKYSNNSNFDLSGLNLVIKLEGEMFDLETINAGSGQFDRSSKTIVWHSGNWSDFSRLPVGTGGQIQFSIKLKPFFQSQIPGTSLDKLVKISSKLSTANVPPDSTASEYMVSASNIVQIGVQPVFKQLVYYNDGTYPTAGPFPLEAGKETTLTVYWQLSNSGNDNEKVKVMGRLPTGIVWANETKANINLPLPVYDSENSEIVWEFDKLPYGAGVFSDKYEAIFRIKITPSTNSDNISLFEEVKFVSTDVFTKQETVINKNSLDAGDIIQ